VEVAKSCFLFFFCFDVLLVYSLYAQGCLYAFLILFRFRNNPASLQKEPKKTHTTTPKAYIAPQIQ